jgi:hypothetical protein
MVLEKCLGTTLGKQKQCVLLGDGFYRRELFAQEVEA